MLGEPSLFPCGPAHLTRAAVKSGASTGQGKENGPNRRVFSDLAILSILTARAKLVEIANAIDAGFQAGFFA